MCTYLKHYQLLKYVNHERHFADHPEAIAELVRKGRGYSVLEKSFAEPDILIGIVPLLVPT